MAQSNFEERIDTYEIESTNVMTGDRDRIRYLYYQLKMSMAKAKQIDIIVSFLMESGVRMLLNDMKRALDRGVRIRILTGNYLGITQPSALYLIKSELGDRVDLRLYNETSRSFHPKSYIFHYGSSNEIYIGSSNISKSALTSGIEWNYRFSDTLDKKNYELFYATFEDLFLNHSIIINDEELKRYSKAWKKPAVSRDLAKYDATEDGEDRNTENVRMLYRPRGAQIEALYALQESRMEGAAKGLVYAATGIGKTYLAILPMAVCYSAVKRFGGNPVLGMVIGAIMLDSSLANAYQAAQGTVDIEVIRLFGLKIEMVGFQGGIIIALMMGFVVAKLDKFFNKVIPDVIKLLVAPMLTVFISTVLLFTLVGPAGRILSNGITDGLMWSTEHLGAFGYALFAGVQQIVVITDLHHIIGAVEAQLIASTGTNFLNPLMSVALFGQSGAVLGYLSLNWKNLKARELCIPSFCSTLFGISEPAIFGVNLRYKFPLIGGCIGGAVAGAYVYYSKLTALGFGTTALPGMAIANPAHHGYINYIIAHAIAITIGFVCTVIFGKMWSAPDKNKNDKKNDTKENDTTKAVITEEPGTVYAAAEGTVKDIEASTDPTFANKVLGDGVVIFPEDGTVMAPCKATVSLVYPTGHAIGLTTADGAEILIHCGVDTVNMNGEGFETLVKEGQEVTAEEALIRFDIDLVKKHGYSPEILVIFTELPEGKTIKTEEKHIAKNDKMAEIV